jgi:translocation and assembly module TamB
VAQQRADITFYSKVLESEINGTARIELKHDYLMEAKLDTHRVPLELVAGNYLPQLAGDFAGETEIHAFLRGPLKELSRIEGRVELPVLAASYRGFQIENAGPIRAEYRDGSLALEDAQLRGTGTELALRGTLPVRTGGSLDASARGTVDLRILELLDPQTDSAGQVRLDVTAKGGISRPDLQGSVEIINGVLQSPKVPIGVEALNGELALRNNRIDIVRLTGESAGGTISATGSVAREEQTQFNVRINTDGVRLRYPEGVRALLASELSLTGGMESAFLRGRVVIQRLSFTDEFDLADFADQFRGESAPASPQSFSGRLRLDVAVNSAEALQLESAKISVQGSSNLRLRGTLAKPVILGRATLTGGELFFLGNRYEILNGVIDFANAVRTEPVVNLAVTTTVDQYNLNMTFSGPINRLRTTYTSSPPLPPVDIINLLAFGKTTEEGNTGRSPSMGAQSILAQGLSSQVSSRVERLVGISHLSIDPGIGKEQGNPGARVVVQQRATRKLLFTFGFDLTQTQSEIVQVEYQVSRGWSVSALRDENGSYAVDVKRRRSF